VLIALKYRFQKHGTSFVLSIAGKIFDIFLLSANLMCVYTEYKLE